MKQFTVGLRYQNMARGAGALRKRREEEEEVGQVGRGQITPEGISARS